MTSRWTDDLDAGRVVASFDSASVLHAATVAALSGRSFPQLGGSTLEAVVVRLGGWLPWALLRGIYTRIGAAEGIAARRLGDVDMESVARMFAEKYPRRRYPAIMVGSSNGALTHLAAALQIPWLPSTVLVPVSHVEDPDRADRVLAFGRDAAGPLLERNPHVALHHMLDPLQDALMARRMTYFRVKWQRLPDAYRRFVTERLAPGGQVILVDDSSTWPVTRVGERHVFQAGGRGGSVPDDYLARPFTPAADELAPEAEWGLDRAFGEDVTSWGANHGVPVSVLQYDHPQTPAATVAAILRAWYRSRGEDADRLVVPSFVLGDPWQTINAAAVPFWTFFAVQPALSALDRYLDAAEPYRDVHVFLFQHGVDSPGIAVPGDFEDVIRRHGGMPHIAGIDRRRFPHDIRSLALYDAVYDGLPRARRPWQPLAVDDALMQLAMADGLAVTGSSRHRS